MKYCTGTIKSLRVKNMGVNEGISNIVTESVVLKTSAPFYRNLLGRLVSFEYNTFLPTVVEALDYVIETAKKYPDHPEMASCMYVDYSNMEVHEINRKEFKALIKTYRQIRKQKKSS